MSKISLKIFFLLVVSLLAVTSGYAAGESETIASYGFGYDTGKKIMETPNLVGTAKFIDGYSDFVAGKQPVYSQEDLAAAGKEVNNLISKKVGDNKDADVQKMISELEIPEKIKDTLSYGSGYMYGVQLAEGQDLIDYNAVIAGIKDAVAEKESKYTPEERSKAMEEMGKLFSARMEEKMKAVAKPNIEAGEKFMAEYKKQDGVKVTPEGMAYKVIKVGTGASPKPTDTVRVSYAGKLIDGKEFDNSSKEKDGVEFQVNQVVDGWKMILPQMKVGDKWEVVIPYSLAYGLQGQPYGEVPIKPGDTLIFEMELLGIK